MKRFIYLLLVFIFLAFISLYLSKDSIARVLIQENVRNLNVPVEIKHVNVNLFKTTIEVKDITISNPEGFKEKVLAEIPYLFIDFDIIDFLKGKIYFSEIRINIGSLYIEKTKQRDVNLNKLKTEDDTPANNGFYEIGRLVLTMGHVKAVDYSSGIIPTVLETDMNIKDEVFLNVTDLDDIAKIVINKVISSNVFRMFGIAAQKVTSAGIQGAALLGKETFSIGKGAAEVFKNILPFGKD